MGKSADKAKPRDWIVLVQLAIVLVTIEAALWSHGRVQVFWFAAGFVSLAGCVLVTRPQAEDLGVGVRGLAQAAWAIPVALVASTIMLAVAWRLGTLQTLHEVLTAPSHAFFYAVWALEQQFILNAFFYKRFEWLMGRTTGSLVVTALLFSLVHMPNPVLVPATFLGGLFFVAVFRRFRNIYPLAIAHAVLGLTLAMAFPQTMVQHMHVGLSFIRVQRHGSSDQYPKSGGS